MRAEAHRARAGGRGDIGTNIAHIVLIDVRIERGVFRVMNWIYEMVIHAVLEPVTRISRRVTSETTYRPMVDHDTLSIIAKVLLPVIVHL